MNIRRNHFQISARWAGVLLPGGFIARSSPCREAKSLPARPASTFALSSSAFTLVELMVAIAVMSLILVIMTQISTGTMQATNRVTQKMEGGEGAGAVFASLRADLANLDAGQGMTMFSSYSGANYDTVLAFITQSRGPNPPSGVSYRFISVAYQLNSTTGELERFVYPITWTDQGLVSDAINTIANGTGSTPTSTYSVLAQGVLRFQAMAVLDNGNIEPLSSSTMPSAASAPSWINGTINGQTIPAPNSGNSFIGLNLNDRGAPPVPYTRNRVQAIIVGLVVVNATNFTMLNNVSKLATTQSLFASPTFPLPSTGVWSGNVTPMDAWEGNLWNGNLNGLGLPKPASAAVQIFQNTFWLQNPLAPQY